MRQLSIWSSATESRTSLPSSSFCFRDWTSWSLVRADRRDCEVDYVTIPFSPLELVARVRALIRRTARSSSDISYAFEGVKVDCLGMEVTRCGEKVRLTTKEFKTLHYMLKNAKRVISRDELLNDVWGDHSYPCTRTIDNHIMKLRQKLEGNPSSPAHFLTTHR